jgi:hypothetical protein
MGPSWGLPGQPETPRTASQKADQFYAAQWPHFAPPLTGCLANRSRRLQLLPGQPATPRTASQKVVWFCSAQLV